MYLWNHNKRQDSNRAKTRITRIDMERAMKNDALILRMLEEGYLLGQIAGMTGESIDEVVEVWKKYKMKELDEPTIISESGVWRYDEREIS